MAELFYGSINVSELIKMAKAGHSAFTKSDKGVIYANINVWKNDEPDKYGNVLSLMLNSTQEKREEEGKVYVGNCKKSERAAPTALEGNELDFLDDDEESPF